MPDCSCVKWTCVKPGVSSSVEESVYKTLSSEHMGGAYFSDSCVTVAEIPHSTGIVLCFVLWLERLQSVFTSLPALSQNIKLANCLCVNTLVCESCLFSSTIWAHQTKLVRVGNKCLYPLSHLELALLLTSWRWKQKRKQQGIRYISQGLAVMTFLQQGPISYFWLIFSYTVIL